MYRFVVFLRLLGDLTLWGIGPARERGIGLGGFSESGSRQSVT
jgi:hypothetical protein